MRSISDVFTDLEASLTEDDVSIQTLLDAFHERGFGFFLFLFALPAALPLPAVGVGTVLGLPLVFLSAQQAVGRRTIWFPEKFKHKSIKRKTVVGMIEAALPWVQRVEFLIKPRLEFVTQGVFSRLIGVFGFIMSLSVCVPLPLTNTVPSFGIALMSVGVMMRDGLAVLAGATIGTLWVSLLVFLGTEGVIFIKDFVKSFF